MKKLLYVALLAVGVIILMTPPAIAQEEKPFTLHGELRFRGEYDANAQDFDKSNSNDSFGYWPYRVRIAAEGKFSKNTTAWIEFQNGGVFGSLGTTQRDGTDINETGNEAELYQGNITLDHLWWKNFSARIGRQEMVEGTELLIGDLDFYQGNTFDGLTGNFKLKKGNIMLFYTRVNERKANAASNAGFQPPDQIAAVAGTRDVNFAGAYTNWDIKVGTLDVYLLNLADQANLSDITTFGARWSRDLVNKNGLFWNIEAAQQSGDASGTDKAKGNVGEGWIGWNMKSGKNNHRFYARMGIASGDNDATDTDQKQFVPLFGDFHNRLGHGDFFQLAGNSTGLGGGPVGGNLGIKGTGVGWNGMFGDRHEVGAEYWSFKTDKKDAATGFDKLGTEWDVWYGYNYSKNLAFGAAVAELSPDDALTGGGGAANDKVDRVYANARLRF